MYRVWMDCDSGFDDVVALMVLARAPGVELVGISTVVGNTHIDSTTANTLAAVEFCGLDTPVYRGAAKPLAQEPQTIERILGAGAMGTLGRRFPAARGGEADTDAVAALAATLRAAEPGSVTILATGPLTNIAVVLLLRPELAAAIDSVVMMGGSATSGNHTAAAEFNAYADPEALDGLLRSGVAVRMFGLNLTRQVLLTPDHEQQLRALGTDRAAVVADHVGFYLRMIDSAGPRPMALHDPSAAAYLRWPELFDLQPARVDVELSRSVGRGATFCEFRVPRKAQPNALVATSVQGHEVMARVMSELQTLLT
ncbi:nucleoside hydrolase [Nocardia wallacei]|uniref:nucleoside hydrolase n=1 Tax=Nocardia wallacei TaxID=480035 RepID=UPI002456788E|nr:nucleoside hydrolase [Nocardia wallacei]